MDAPWISEAEKFGSRAEENSPIELCENCAFPFNVSLTMKFETIKINFDKGLWSKAMVKVAVRKGVITKEQYQEIVGEAF